MKATTIFVAIMLLLVGSTASQNIIYERNLRNLPNLHVECWPENWTTSTTGDEPDTTGKNYVVSISFHAGFNDQHQEVAYYQFTNDTLQVYGIAAALSTPRRYRPEGVPGPVVNDTNMENVYNYLRLYEAEEDSLRHIGEELPVNINHTPVSYYIDLDVYNTSGDIKYPPIPIYERYFQAPITVADSFYVGRRYEATLPEEAWLGLMQIASVFDSCPTVIALHQNYVSHIVGHVNRWDYWQRPYNQLIPIIFPIIAPPDTTSDTTNVGTEQPDMVYRYTAVTPNPATGIVRITSSFQIQSIAAYNEEGLKVFEGKASGLVTTLNVSAWPKGIYLLHITTSEGVTVKKLLVQ